MSANPVPAMVVRARGFLERKVFGPERALYDGAAAMESTVISRNSR